MSGSLPKKREQFNKIPNAKIAIVYAMWHSEYTESMVERCKSELMDLEVQEKDIMIEKLPGSLELPYASRILFEKYEELDAVVAFGVVFQGKTTHDKSVIQTVVEGFLNVQERFNKPIINEVIGVSDYKDAEKRSDESDMNKGLEAAFAVSELISWKRKIENSK